MVPINNCVLNNYSDSLIVAFEFVMKVKIERKIFCFCLFCCCIFVSYVLCSQHGYIFLAGAGAKPPDERKSGRHTEYRLIKYGYRHSAKRLGGRRQSVNIRDRKSRTLLNSQRLGFWVKGLRWSRVLVNVYEIYTTRMGFMLPDEFQCVLYDRGNCVGNQNQTKEE